MVPVSNRQEAVTAIKNQIISSYPSLWSDMISQWQTNGSEDRCWLLYSANYLFRTQNIRWAIDPFTIYTRLGQTPPFDLPLDLQQLDFVLLTHSHADHLDQPLIHSLAHLPIRWVIPAFLQPKLEGCGLDPRNIIVPKPLEPICLHGICITPFDGLHFHTTSDGVPRGVPAMGYHICCGNQSWLFPGDTRSHHPEKIPVFSPPDIVFAHLWLGKACADMLNPPKVEDFCRFFLALQPQRLVITHLHEIGRVLNEFWDCCHYDIVKNRLQQLNPAIPVASVTIGQSITL
jgi:L-ascorbate metabolism protein UlaG (beta-lactamase superfamily)